ncbi:hypothetical protein D3C75_1122040 [compost metagenome]
MVEPSEISMPPLIITRVSGSATMPIQIKSLVLNSSILTSSMRGLMAPNSRISATRISNSATSQLSFSLLIYATSFFLRGKGRTFLAPGSGGTKRLYFCAR